MASNCVIHALLYDTEIVSRSFLSLHVIHGRIFECIPFDCVFSFVSFKRKLHSCIVYWLSTRKRLLYIVLIVFRIGKFYILSACANLFGGDSRQLFIGLLFFRKNTMSLVLTSLCCFRCTFGTYYSKNIASDSSTLISWTLKYWQIGRAFCFDNIHEYK